VKLFFDANIFFAAAGSPKGGSAFVLELGKRKKFEAVTVQHALLEAERNIEKKLGGEYLARHHQNLLELKPYIQSISGVSIEMIIAFEKFVPLKDVPILLGAILSNSQFLITLDRRDFLNNKRLSSSSLPFEIKTPGDFLKQHLNEL
jgi:predicted nucleic acid-binding protein